MWSLLSAAALLYAAAVSAVSTAGNRLLVVLDDVAEKDTYGQFLGDLTGAYLSVELGEDATICDVAF
jgi:oligosaccharyltransferase complex subunit beta